MLKDKRVLIVDDSATIRMFLRAVLAHAGALVAEVESGEQALALLQGNDSYELILLDLILPDIDGIEVLHRLRTHDDTTAVVVLTGMGGIKSATAAVREGADGYMEKQDLALGGDHAEFFYALEQAMEHRAGIVAQRQLQQFKTDFYSMITHDLRNPAGGALLALQLLSWEDADNLTASQKELISLATQAAQQLNNLINDYLDFAKIDAGFLRIDPSQTEVVALLENAVRLLNVQAQTRKQRLSVHTPDTPIYAWVDGERLKQVLENLTSNAIKYTPEGGKIDVTLTHDDDLLVVEVKDNGFGISPAQMVELFSKYHRGTSTSVRAIRGTGLGLYVVKEIVEAHGGTISAQSEGVPGKGSCFRLSVPIQAKAANDNPISDGEYKPGLKSLQTNSDDPETTPGIEMVIA
jgi:signal transduction histidine kinase